MWCTKHVVAVVAVAHICKHGERAKQTNGQNAQKIRISAVGFAPRKKEIRRKRKATKKYSFLLHTKHSARILSHKDQCWIIIVVVC